MQCYNAALTLSSIYEHTDLSVMCENEGYLELCRVLLGQERPSLDSLNSAMSGNLVRVMMPCGSVTPCCASALSFDHGAGLAADQKRCRGVHLRRLDRTPKADVAAL